MLKILFLVSGGGGNLKFLHNAAQRGFIHPIELEVIADRECTALAFADKAGLRNRHISYKRSAPEVLQQILADSNPDLIISNWHKIIDADTVSRFAGRIINLHYSLLPAFAGSIGEDTISAAIDAGCKFVGTTCHYVNEDVDAGQIIAQSVVSATDDMPTIVTQVFRSGCLCLLNGLSIARPNRLTLSGPTQEIPTFSPRLNFNAAMFDEDFWQQVRLL